MKITNTDRKIILKFLQSQSLTVLSTMSYQTGNPESALVAFAETEDLEIIFETQDMTRKYKNIEKNHVVSLVIGWDLIFHITLQYEGIAERIQKNELEKFQKIFLSKDTPCTEKFLYHPNARLFKIKPTWIRYSDYSSFDKPVIKELFF